MKLHELDDPSTAKPPTRLLENQGGKCFDVFSIGPRRAMGMLHKVHALIEQHRRCPDFHKSHEDPAYLQLIIMEQALVARLSEQQPPSMATPGTASNATAAMNDPKVRAVMDKVKRGQTLTPDEQLTVNKVAISKENKQPNRMVREQSELQQAQVVLAAQDMIDRLQGMLEDISEMQFKDLPALANSIKNDMGVDLANQFQSTASMSLSQLIQALQAGKSEMESAQGLLTGQAPIVPGESDLDMDSADQGEQDIDLSLDSNIDLGDEEDNEEEVSDTTAFGRERR